MGLDMYLTAKRTVKKFKMTQLKSEDVMETVEVAYWRKANHIHRWFVKNVQHGNDDCGTYCVDPQQLRDLVELCRQVLDDHDLAPILLPVTSGFFFGSGSYDGWYFYQLQSTIDDIENGLKLSDEWDFSYSSSW